MIFQACWPNALILRVTGYSEKKNTKRSAQNLIFHRKKNYSIFSQRYQLKWNYPKLSCVNEIIWTSEWHGWWNTCHSGFRFAVINFLKRYSKFRHWYFIIHYFLFHQTNCLFITRLSRSVRRWLTFSFHRKKGKKEKKISAMPNVRDNNILDISVSRTFCYGGRHV